jgi:hypothetical protein
MLRAFTALRPLLLSLALLTGGGVIAASVAEPAFAQRAWRTHKDVKYGYRVEFPGVPSVSQDTTPGGVVMNVARLEAGTTGAFLVVSVSGDLDPKTALDNATAGALAVASNRLISKADLTVDGAPARDLVMRSTDTGVTTTVRFVVQGSNLHQVMAVAAADVALEGSDRFINSFRLLPVAAPTAPGTMAPVSDD